MKTGALGMVKSAAFPSLVPTPGSVFQGLSQVNVLHDDLSEELLPIRHQSEITN